MVKIADWVITDGARYIYRDRTGKFVPGSGQAMADIYDKKQAENILNSYIPKTLRKLFRIEKVSKEIPNTKPPSIEVVRKNTGKALETEEIQRWISKIENLNGLAGDARVRKNELVSQLSDVDKQLAVLDHYIEFTKLNAAQYCQAGVMRKERLTTRRTIKNELSVLNIILSKKINDFLSEEVMKEIKGLDNRTYTPKALGELFDF